MSASLLGLFLMAFPYKQHEAAQGMKHLLWRIERFSRIVIERPLRQYELEPAAAGRGLGELVNYSLLTEAGGRYEVTHQLVHRYARERMEAAAGGMVVCSLSVLGA